MTGRSTMMSGPRRSARSSWWMVGWALVALLLAGCGARAADVVATGPSRPQDPAFGMYERRCASCHGERAQGGSGPALVGHTTEQFVRQVRAPVGDMPMFGREDFSDDALALLIEYLDTLATGADGHGGHDHGVGGLTKQDASQMVHWLALTALDRPDPENAVHWINEALSNLSGTHLAAMERALDDVRREELRSARSVIVAMVTDDWTVRAWGPPELVLRLALDAAERGDQTEVDHQLAHTEVDEVPHIAAIRGAAAGGELGVVRSELSTWLGLGAGSDSHRDGEETHADAGERPSPEIEDQAGSPVDDHEADGEAPVHDDAGAPPHDH